MKTNKLILKEKVLFNFKKRNLFVSESTDPTTTIITTTKTSTISLFPSNFRALNEI